MRNIAFTVDVEKDYNSDSYEDLRKNLPKLAALLKRRKIKATFFVTSDCLEKDPALFRKLHKEGHEIALHGYMHERWDTMNLHTKRETLNKAIAVYKKVFNEMPLGFRAPQFSADFELIRVLEENGFLYDSSIVQFPLTQTIFFPSRLFLYIEQLFIKSRIRHNKMKIWEIFVSSFGLPISAFTLRRLPKWLFITLHEAAFAKRGKSWTVFLSHSYELDKAGLKRIENYLDWYKNANFVRMRDIIRG